jgi:hypothetical protein
VIGFNGTFNNIAPMFIGERNGRNILKFNKLFSSHTIVVLKKVCTFIKVITVKVSPPG